MFWLEHVSHEEFLEHSAKGSTWKNHKYVSKKLVNGKWVYQYAKKSGGESKTGYQRQQEDERNRREKNMLAIESASLKAIKASEKKIEEYQSQIKWLKDENQIRGIEKAYSKEGPVTTTVYKDGSPTTYYRAKEDAEYVQKKMGRDAQIKVLESKIKKEEKNIKTAKSGAKRAGSKYFK